MRKLTLIIAIALAVPALATAAELATGDGSLGVTSANGTIVVQGRGVIYGHFDSGTILVLDYKPDDGESVPAISGGKTKLTRTGTGAVAGSDVRFLLPSGRYTVQLIATDISASAVGKGTIVGTGLGTPDDGSFSVNGGKPEQLTARGATSDFFGKGP
jgi:hypothetical protein